MKRMETCHEELEELEILDSTYNNGTVGGNNNTGSIGSGGNSSPAQQQSNSPAAPLTGCTNTATTNFGISTSSLSSIYQQQPHSTDGFNSPVGGPIPKACVVRLGSRKHSITPSLKQIQQILTREVRLFDVTHVIFTHKSTQIHTLHTLTNIIIYMSTTIHSILFVVTLLHIVQYIIIFNTLSCSVHRVAISNDFTGEVPRILIDGRHCFFLLLQVSWLFSSNTGTSSVDLILVFATLNVVKNTA